MRVTLLMADRLRDDILMAVMLRVGRLRGDIRMAAMLSVTLLRVDLLMADILLADEKHHKLLVSRCKTQISFIKLVSMGGGVDAGTVLVGGCVDGTSPPCVPHFRVRYKI